MKHFLPLLFALLTTPLWSQTGNGVVLLTDASHTFTPTTVDSTTSFSFQLVNEVGVAQTVFFGALDAPFSMDDNTPVEIPSQDTIDVTIHFTPTDLGSFQDTISFVGGVFGSAELALAGDGIQVVLTWTPDTLSFDTTAIGQTSSQTISISSIGNGTGAITDIAFSNNIFSIDSVNSAFSIPEGGTDILTVVYAPINAGTANETMTLSTNDPNNPTITIDLTAVGNSEVSGEICDITWTADNSPYTLTDNVIVPEGCTLNIDPGVEVIGNDHDIEVFGALFANGAESNLVQIEVGELLSHTVHENMILTHTEVTETNEIGFTDIDFRPLRESNIYGSDSLPYFFDFIAADYQYLYSNENADSHFGKYSEDFSDNNGQGWSHDGPVDSQNENAMYEVYYDGSSGSYYTNNIYSPSLSLNSGESPDFVSFRAYQNYWSTSYTRTMRYYVRYDGGGWNQLQTISSPVDGQWYNLSYELSPPENVQTVQFRFEFYYRYFSSNRVDDFVLTTNFYSGEDNPLPEAAAPVVASLSTGGLQLFESTYNGDFHSVGDSIEVASENSAIHVSDARNKDSHGLGLYAGHVNFTTINSTVSGHGLDGIHIESLSTDWSDQNGLLDGNGEDGIFVNGDLNLDAIELEVNGNGEDGIAVNGDLDLVANELDVNGNGADGIVVNGDFDLDATELDVNGNGEDGLDTGENSNMTLYGARIQGNEGRALNALAGSIIDLDYVLMDDNGGRGVELGAGGNMSLSNCRLRGNGAEGIHSASPVTISHCDIAFSEGTGLVVTGNNFHTLNNSILWGNNSSNYTQIDIGGGVISTSYSTVQGRSSYGTSGGGQYYWGEGVIEADPLFADDDLHLEIFSPCVDGGQPWHQDAYMPFGLGGVRADMGMYGGPDNAYWGGEALPDGASALNSITDSPQDQGGVVGLTFGASFYDNSELVNNVTSYAFWRHYYPTGQAISTLDEGNWELIGEMPAQSFNGYAYQAATLGNTNDTGPFSSCYTVVAQTDDPDTYWYSNVMCGESVDNLAPGAPDLNGMPLEEGGALISWVDPAIEDYGYTRIVSDAGFEAEVSADTLVVDAGALAGSTVTYTATHFDINGNESEPTDLTLELGSAYDIVPLHAGWNLISLDRAPEETPIASLFGDLIEDNLLYVTGFDEGVSFYDPNGLPFLNTLFGLTPGYGYWVKVAQNDTLRVPGTPLGGGYLPTLDAGWNLIAYTAEAPLTPDAFFADLIADGDLAYLTGFDNGIQVFDPNGLPFLNTLTTLNNGYGYWLKTSADYAGMGLVDDAKGANPNYVVLNGTSNLGAYAGQAVLVLDESGRQVAELPILEGGYLMTTAVYGSEAGEGLQPGAGLQLEFAGERIALDGAWTGDMAHLKLDVEFPIGLSVFPNPATDRVDLRWNQAASGQVRAEVFDATGKQVLDTPMGPFLSGWQQASIAVDALAPGHYTLHLLVDGRSVHQTALQRTE